MPQHRILILSSLAALPISVLSAQGIFFDAAHVAAYEDRLQPGAGVTIYGTGLGPPDSCTGKADPARHETPGPSRPEQNEIETRIYPTDLCGVQVLVGGVPAGLLYVSPSQINFKVPQQTPVTGFTDVAVRFQGVTQSVRMALGLPKTEVALESPASIGMPVWLKVSVAYRHGCVSYPFDSHPEEWWYHDVEVRHNRQLLPRAPMPGGFGGRIASLLGPCSNMSLPKPSRHLGRLPLHLWYRFDEPGTYEVRYRLWKELPGVRGWRQAGTVVETDWVPIEIQPGTPQQRAAWLAEQAARRPQDPTELLTDFLPSILGVPDEASLRLVAEYLYHPNKTVRGFAAYGLGYWSVEDSRRIAGEMARARGSNEAVRQVMEERR